MLKDQPPTIAFVKPGHDTKVSPIEEVFSEVKAQDDYGVARVELVYSVNGGAEKTVPLVKDSARKLVTAGHTFFLEELGLQTGDFVSYYARAADRAAPAQAASTDIYFLEVRPFRRDYRQAEQGGEGGPAAASSRARSRSSSARSSPPPSSCCATAPRLADKEWSEDLATVGLIQGRLREQVDQLLTRMVSRGVTETSADLQQDRRRAAPGDVRR